MIDFCHELHKKRNTFYLLEKHIVVERKNAGKVASFAKKMLDFPIQIRWTNTLPDKKGFVLYNLFLVIYFVREEFIQHGIGDYVTAKCADVCELGFGMENIADAGGLFYQSVSAYVNLQMH